MIICSDCSENTRSVYASLASLPCICMSSALLKSSYFKIMKTVSLLYQQSTPPSIFESVLCDFIYFNQLFYHVKCFYRRWATPKTFFLLSWSDRYRTSHFHILCCHSKLEITSYDLLRKGFNYYESCAQKQLYLTPKRAVSVLNKKKQSFYFKTFTVILFINIRRKASIVM